MMHIKCRHGRCTQHRSVKADVISSSSHGCAKRLCGARRGRRTYNHLTTLRLLLVRHRVIDVAVGGNGGRSACRPGCGIPAQGLLPVKRSPGNLRAEVGHVGETGRIQTHVRPLRQVHRVLRGFDLMRCPNVPQIDHDSLLRRKTGQVVCRNVSHRQLGAMVLGSAFFCYMSGPLVGSI